MASEDTVSERVLKFEVLVVLGALLMFLLVSGFGFWLVDREQEARVAAQEALRRENVRGLQILLVDQCRQIEELKAGERTDAKRDFKRLDETLAILGIARTEAIENAARAELDSELQRYAPKPGGCGEYPDPITPP